MATDPEIHRWERLTKSAFDRVDRTRAVVIVTSSPLEVHGPHLPLGADALEGEALAERAVRLLPERHRARPFLKLPFIYAAGDPLPHPGSLHFRPSTVIAVLEDLGRTLAAQGFRDVLVSNFHGSPRHFLAQERACETVSRATGIRMVALFSLMLSRHDGGDPAALFGALPGVRRADLEGDAHAGLVETAQLLALHPDLVAPGYDALPRRTVAAIRSARSLRGLLRDIRAAVAFFRTNTYAGAPAGATAALGERMLDRLGALAAEAYAQVLDGAIPPSACHSPLWRLRFLFLNPLLVRVFDRLLGHRPLR